MDEELLIGKSPQKVLLPQHLDVLTNSSNIQETLEILIEDSRNNGIRSHLASVVLMNDVLDLINSLFLPACRDYLTLKLSLRLLRNLCAGEIVNQSSFITLNGVALVSALFRSTMPVPDLDHTITRVALQALANVSLAGAVHQQAVWNTFFADPFLSLAAIRSHGGIVDPLCMIIHTCSHGSPSFAAELFGDGGLPIIAELLRTASVGKFDLFHLLLVFILSFLFSELCAMFLPVGFEEHWLKLLVSKTCTHEFCFSQLFAKLLCSSAEINSPPFSGEQAYLLGMVAGVFHGRIGGEELVPSSFSLCIFEIFKKSLMVLESVLGGSCSFSAGINEIDVLRFSVAVLKCLCALDDEQSLAMVDQLSSAGLVIMLLQLLRRLGPPSLMRRVMEKNGGGGGARGLGSPRTWPSPAKGLRRDIVSAIGNCAFRRRLVQDQIREEDGVLLLLQQCVHDEDDPFLREWSIWCLRNLLEGNAENQQKVAELEFQGSITVPELANAGFRVELDEYTHRAKLVNTL